MMGYDGLLYLVKYIKGECKMSQVLENPRGGCVLAGINSVLGAIHKVCPVYHSGPGCCMQTTAADQGQSGHKSSCFVSSVSIPSSNMLEKEVAFGGTDKLRTTIQGAIDIIDADAYFVLTGCTAGIIGEYIFLRKIRALRRLRNVREQPLI